MVLVELVVPGRFFAGMFFPFAMGLLRSRGVPSRWVRVVAPAEMMLDAAGNRQQVDDVASVVLRAVQDHDATHVLFSHPAGQTLAGSLRGAVPGLCLGLLDAERSLGASAAETPGTDLPVIAADQHAILWWIGTSGGREADLPLVNLSQPDYGFEPVGAARHIPPFVYLLAGPLCSHRRPLEESLFFAGREALELPDRWGCAFCAQSAPTDALATSGHWATRRVERQLAGVARTLTAREGLRVLVVGAGLLRDPVTLARLVLNEADLPPCRLLLGYRADEIVASRDALAEAAQLLAAADHGLDVNLVGVESFSDRQLDRYHKGYGPEVNLAAVGALRQLEARSPAFGFSQYGGLSTILYDPWATPADVALNLAVVRHFRLSGLCGKLLTSRLRLTEAVPLTRVARHEGLLVDTEQDELLHTARRNFYAGELPWRFADGRMDPLNRLTTRLEPGGDLAGDPLHEALGRWRASSGLEPLDMAEALTRAASRCDEGVDPEALLEQAARAPAPAMPTAGGAPELDPVSRWFRDSWEYGATMAGAKPVTKLEDGLGPELQDAISRELARRVGGELTTHTRLRRWDHGHTREMFLGADAGAVEEVMTLMEARDHAGAAHAAVARTGALLGYPECCAEAFARSASVLRDANGWLLLKRRLETPGAAPPELNPCLMPYVPCSMDCARTLELTRRVNEHRHDSWEEYGCLPTLVFLGRTTEVAALRPRGPVRAGQGRVAPSTLQLSYDGVVPLWLEAGRRQLLEQGDTLEVEPGLIRVLARGREIGWFALEAFLWWHEEVLHPELWRRCVEELEERGDAVTAPPAPEEPVEPDPGSQPRAATPEPVAAPDEQEQRRLALRDLLARALARVQRRHPDRMRGFTVESLEARGAPQGWGELVLTLHRNHRPLVATITRASDQEPAFARSGPFAISHSAQTPADTRDRQKILNFVVRLLHKVVKRC